MDGWKNVQDILMNLYFFANYMYIIISIIWKHMEMDIESNCDAKNLNWIKLCASWPYP